LRVPTDFVKTDRCSRVGCKDAHNLEISRNLDSRVRGQFSLFCSLRGVTSTVVSRCPVLLGRIAGRIPTVGWVGRTHS